MLQRGAADGTARNRGCVDVALPVLLVVLLIAGVLGWQAAGQPLPALPFLDSDDGGPAWPLTGVPVDAVADRPALAVKIENSIDARPQTGLNAADVVWEEVVEGGITRFVAVYHSNLPPEIGPVRSIRPMDPAIAAPLHGLLAFSGGVPTYVDAARSSGLQVLTQDSGIDGFHRTSTRRAPHCGHSNAPSGRHSPARTRTNGSPHRQTAPIVRAGWPATRWNGATDRDTTAPMPTIANRPISMPGPMTARAPMVTPSRTLVSSVCSSGSDGRSA